MTPTKTNQKLLSLVAFVIPGLLALSCTSATPPHTPDIPATVSAVMQEAAPAPTPTPVPTPTPDIPATVQAQVQIQVKAELERAVAAMPTPTPPPSPTPAPVQEEAPTPTVTALPLFALSHNLSEMVDRVKSGVVRIETNLSSGTGVIFEGANGSAFILTNHHVVEEAQRIQVQVDDSLIYPALLRGYDGVKDLAVLEICCGEFEALNFRDASSVKSGTEVVTMGYPLGFSGSPTVTRGIVSAVRFDPNHETWLFQTDAPINPGNSGGPLLANNGDVLGINTYNYDWSLSGDPVQGVGFAISQQSIQDILPDLKAGSRVEAPTPEPTITPYPTPTLQAFWSSYSNLTADFSINVPSNWKVQDSNRKSVRFESPRDFAHVWVGLGDLGRATGEQMLKTYLESQSANFPGGVEILQDVTSSDFGEEKLAYAQYRLQVSSTFCEEEYQEWLWVRGRKYFWLQMGACVHATEELRPVLSFIETSFVRR